MHKFNFLRNGERKLPPGFRFQPTEEEIVFQYLARKIFSCPLPATVIPEIDKILSFDPWDLPGESEQDKYFFSNRESNYRNVKRGSRATCCGGYWRVIGLDRQIRCSKRMPIVGMKKTLVFCKGKNSSAAARTDWFMHLYCISVPRNTSCNIQQKKQGCLIQIGKWDLCHVFLKKNERLRKYGDLIMTTEESDADSSCASSSSDFDSDSSVSSEASSSSD